jgi:hypothetical protein
MTPDLQIRACELIELSISNLVDGLGCTPTNALKLLLIQSAIRLPGDEGLQILQQMYNVTRKTYDDGGWHL